MPAGTQQQFIESMRLYLLEFAKLPVKHEGFSLGVLAPEGRTLCLQFGEKHIERMYVDGTQKILQPFSLLYRDVVVSGTKEAATEILNAIGAWMEKHPLPYLGEGLEVTRMEQMQLASIVEQTDHSVTAHAGYLIGYDTK